MRRFIDWLRRKKPDVDVNPSDYHGSGLTIEYMRELEASLTPGQKKFAFAYARELGWTAGTTPPMWVWYQIYCQAQRVLPTGNLMPQRS